MNPAALKEQTLSLVKRITQLQKKMDTTEKRINTLKEQGVLDANPYWMKNKKGEPAYFCLYSSEKIKPKKTVQKIKYVGQSEVEIKNILNAIERAKEVQRLEQIKNNLSSVIDLVEDALNEASQYIQVALEQGELDAS